eukprot:TRINITY_DN1841_c0_g1_i1.p1 TRINITY_DN1841_c0_g1~~TRINITY_DN1841_c0_g1_i1.p1  ORF type:complete len:227 (+),score=39.62 TRINITY_DN1841_c0_g1_i1:184-864(+)
MPKPNSQHFMYLTEHTSPKGVLGKALKDRDCNSLYFSKRSKDLQNEAAIATNLEGVEIIHLPTNDGLVGISQYRHVNIASNNILFSCYHAEYKKTKKYKKSVILNHIRRLVNIAVERNYWAIVAGGDFNLERDDVLTLLNDKLHDDIVSSISLSFEESTDKVYSIIICLGETKVNIDTESRTPTVKHKKLDHNWEISRISFKRVESGLGGSSMFQVTKQNMRSSQG